MVPQIEQLRSKCLEADAHATKTAAEYVQAQATYASMQEAFQKASATFEALKQDGSSDVSVL